MSVLVICHRRFGSWLDDEYGFKADRSLMNCCWNLQYFVHMIFIQNVHSKSWFCLYQIRPWYACTNVWILCAVAENNFYPGCKAVVHPELDTRTDLLVESTFTMDSPMKIHSMKIIVNNRSYVQWLSEPFAFIQQMQWRQMVLTSTSHTRSC